MIFRGSLIPVLAKAAALSLALSAGAFSQSLEELVERSATAMEESRWEQALELNNRAISQFGRKNPFLTYGAQFGAIYYRKGICEMKLKRWPAAMESFEICYRDFRNVGTKRDNPFQNLALLKWGEAAMGAEAWELAASKFAKFTDERDKEHDQFPLGAFYINLAVCQYKLGHIPAGNENLEIALTNKANFPTPDSGIIAGFQVLVEAAVAWRNEQSLLDFVGKNRGELIIDPAEMRRYSGVFLKLAGDALNAGMQRAAIALYQFVPSEDADLAGPGAPEIVKLAGIALIHERNGNVRGAFAAYQQLVLGFPQAANREEYFYHLVRASALIGQEELTRSYAGWFLKDFPNSQRRAEIREIGVEPADGETVLPALKPPAPAPAAQPVPDTADFAAALDLYQGRKYQEARAAFAKIRGRDKPAETSLAGFYETECLRKLGDLDGLANALKSVVKSPDLGGQRLRQLEIDTLWEAVRSKNWEQADQLAKPWSGELLPGGQRAQVACCLALALENLGRPDEALNAFNIAMTADAGASEDVARRAALGVLRILNADPDVQVAIAKWGSPDQDRGSPGFLRLKEAASVAALFELSLGAGSPFPGEFRHFLKYAEPSAHN